MKKKLIRYALLSVTAFFTLYFSYHAVFQTFYYFRLSTVTKAQIKHWSVQQLSADRFCLIAKYCFDIQGKTIFGNTCFQKNTYLNSYAAKNALEDQSSQKEKEVWFDPANPSHCSLEKNFPTNLCIRAFFSWGIFLYFLSLPLYFGKTSD